MEHLQQLRAAAAHCQAFVDQSRQRLLTEFEAWFTAAFLGEASPTPKPKPAECVSKAEEFDELQHKLLQDDTLGFYRARTRTDMRVRMRVCTSTVASWAPVLFLNLHLSLMHPTHHT